MKLIIASGIIVLVGLGAYAVHKPTQPIKNVAITTEPGKGSVLGAVVTETKIESPSIPTPKLVANEVVIPKTEAEQDTQIDQNTIKNIEQDGKLAENGNRITAIEQKPAPAPQIIYIIPVSDSIHTPIPTPQPILDPISLSAVPIVAGPVSDSGSVQYITFSLDIPQNVGISLGQVRCAGTCPSYRVLDDNQQYCLSSTNNYCQLSMAIGGDNKFIIQTDPSMKFGESIFTFKFIDGPSGNTLYTTVPVHPISE